MFGASREALSRQVVALDDRASDAGFDRLADELFTLARFLDVQPQLRVALADSGQQVAVREAIAREILGPRVSPLALQVVLSAVGERWSSDLDLVLAIEQLAAQAAFITAAADGSLDATEAELFRFSRAVAESPELQMALTDPAQAAATKAAIVGDLLAGRTTAATRTVLQHTVGNLHGQRIDAAINQLGQLAARQRQRVIAEIKVAAPLEPRQAQRLADVLSTMVGRTVRLNVAVDPAVLGGVHVKIGDEVVDGTVATRLAQARRAVLGS